MATSQDLTGCASRESSNANATGSCGRHSDFSNRARRKSFSRHVRKFLRRSRRRLLGTARPTRRTATGSESMPCIDSLTGESWRRYVSVSNQAAMSKNHQYPRYEGLFLKDCCTFQQSECAPSCFCRRVGCGGVWTLRPDVKFQDFLSHFRKLVRCRVDWTPILRQPDKTQFSANGQQCLIRLSQCMGPPQRYSYLPFAGYLLVASRAGRAAAWSTSSPLSLIADLSRPASSRFSSRSTLRCNLSALVRFLPCV